MRYTKKQIADFLNSAPGRKATNAAYDLGYEYGSQIGKREVVETIIEALGLKPVLVDIENRLGSLETYR